MGNHYFKFKQFTVLQDRSAMKVCTDACLQGAYTALYLHGKPHVQQVLDIGTGTGLLSLMLAQQTTAHITGLELDASACAQARENFESSPWKPRLQAVCTDARLFTAPQPFDFIISNPPFYEDDLKSTDTLRNQAMHATALRFPSLLLVIGAQLSADGEFSILLPAVPFAGFRALALEAGFYLQRVLHIRHKPGDALFRSIGIFGKMQVDVVEQEMEIYGDGKAYSPAFVQLLGDYYLYL